MAFRNKPVLLWKKISLLITGLSLLTTAGFAQIIRGTYAIKNSQTQLVLRVQDARKANGTPIVSYSPVNWKCVTWDFNHVEGNTYQLRKFIHQQNPSARNGKSHSGCQSRAATLVTLQANQEYEFIPAGKDRYKIRLKGTDLYITPSEDTGPVNSSVNTGQTNGFGASAVDPFIRRNQRCRPMKNFLFLLLTLLVRQAQTPIDLSGFQKSSGVTVTNQNNNLVVNWPATGRETARLVINLDKGKPLFNSIQLSEQGKFREIAKALDPAFVLTVGKRDLVSQNGWNIFFDKTNKLPHKSYAVELAKRTASVKPLAPEPW